MSCFSLGGEKDNQRELRGETDVLCQAEEVAAEQNHEPGAWLPANQGGSQGKEFEGKWPVHQNLQLLLREAEEVEEKEAHQPKSEVDGLQQAEVLVNSQLLLSFFPVAFRRLFTLYTPALHKYWEEQLKLSWIRE